MFIDILDGAHLHHRQLANWCSAIVCFDRIEKKIRSAYVAIPTVEKFYFATAEVPGAYFLRVPGLSRLESRPKQEDFILHKRRRSTGWNPIELTPPKSAVSLEKATLAIYAQRCLEFSNLRSNTNLSRLNSWLAETEDAQKAARGSEPVFRVINLGGNPMLVRMCDGGPDVVVEVSGASPNDWVPGAYIAQKAGAFLGSIDGTALKEMDFCEALLSAGKSKTTYIASTNEALYRQTSELLRPAASAAVSE